MKIMNTLKKFGAAAKTKTAKVMGGATVGAFAIFGSSIAAFAAPSTGNTAVDNMLTEMESGFGTANTAFVYLGLAAIPVTLIVVLFFWLRGKFKQSVSGA